MKTFSSTLMGLLTVVVILFLAGILEVVTYQTVDNKMARSMCAAVDTTSRFPKFLGFFPASLEDNEYGSGILGEFCDKANAREWILRASSYGALAALKEDHYSIKFTLPYWLR